MADVIKGFSSNGEDYKVDFNSLANKPDIGSIQSRVDSLGVEIESLRSAVGSPLVAASAVDMTDTDKIYVYVGSETGYTHGNWYYYDGYAWQSGGVYNSSAFVTDSTLSVAGMAADAKAAGDELRGKMSRTTIYTAQEITRSQGLVKYSDLSVYGDSITNYWGRYSVIDVTGGETVEVDCDSVDVNYIGAFTVNSDSTKTKLLTGTSQRFRRETITLPANAIKLYLNGDTRQSTPNYYTGALIEESEFWGNYDKLLPYTKIDSRELLSKKYYATKSSATVASVFIGKYNAENDMQVMLGNKSGNNLFDFRYWFRVPNATRITSQASTPSNRFIIVGGDTDFLSPYVMQAVNNADGDFPTAKYLTGGWHMYQQKTSGDYSPTARTSEWHIYADGRELADGEGVYCDEVRIEWINYVQAGNTEKADGTGREVLKEHITVCCNHALSCEVSSEITALEDILIFKYYGLQTYENLSGTATMRYIGSRVNRGSYPVNGNTNSGDTYANGAVVENESNVFVSEIDSTYDLGTGYANSYAYSVFNADIKKNYYNLIRNDDGFPLGSGETIRFRGKYRVEPVATV